MKSKNLCLRVPMNMYDYLIAMCRLKGVTISDLVRDIIYDTAINNKEYELTNKDIFDDMVKNAGEKKSVTYDTSVNQDKNPMSGFNQDNDDGFGGHF